MGFLAGIAPVLGAVTAGASLLKGGGDKPAGSGNQAFGYLKDTYAPQASTGVGANNFMAGLLGVPGGDTAGADAGFASYLSKAGYAPALERLQAGVTQGAAAKGLLNSGSTQKALVRYGAGLDQQFYNNYFQNLNTLNQRGLDAGQTIGGAGSTQTAGEQGITGKIGSALNAIDPLTAGFKKLGAIFA